MVMRERELVARLREEAGLSLRAWRVLFGLTLPVATTGRGPHGGRGGAPFQVADHEQRRRLITAESPPTGDERWDSFLAALAEWLAVRTGTDVPAWVHDDGRSPAGSAGTRDDILLPCLADVGLFGPQLLPTFGGRFGG